MADKALSSLPVAPKSNNLITLLNTNDVLLGRGMGPSQFIGNKHFRRLVAKRKKEYCSVPGNKEKDRIARDLFNSIQSLGGRFLKLVESEIRVDFSVKNKVWYEVDDLVAVEKCKQGLRQHRDNKGSTDETNMIPLDEPEDTSPHAMVREIVHPPPPGSSSPSKSLFPSGGHERTLDVGSSMLCAEIMAMAELKRRQAEQQLLTTRILLQQRQQDVAFLDAALASSSGSAPYSLVGGRFCLEPSIQALLQQMENGLLPPHSAGLVRNPQLPPKKWSVNQVPYFDTSQAPYPPSDPEEEDPVYDDDDKEDKKPQYRGIKELFPQKLYRMLEEVEKNDQEDVLSFSPSGRAFAIHNPGKFMEDIMPRYFSTTRMSSFRHQLGLYGFRRVTEGCDKGGYCHEFFLKGQKGLVEKIKRNKSTGLRWPNEDIEEVVRAHRQMMSGSGFALAEKIKPKTPALPKPPSEDLEEAIRAYQQAMPGAGFRIGIPASQLMVHNSSRQQDLISQSSMLNGGGQRLGLGNSLSGLPPSVMDILFDPRISFGSLVQGENGAMRNQLLAAGNGTSGRSGDPTTASLLQEQKQSGLIIAQLQRRRQQISDLLHLIS